jgi:hypothetical protein
MGRSRGGEGSASPTAFGGAHNLTDSQEAGRPQAFGGAMSWDDSLPRRAQAESGANELECAVWGPAGLPARPTAGGGGGLLRGTGIVARKASTGERLAPLRVAPQVLPPRACRDTAAGRARAGGRGARSDRAAAGEAQATWGAEGSRLLVWRWGNLDDLGAWGADEARAEELAQTCSPGGSPGGVAVFGAGRAGPGQSPPPELPRPGEARALLSSLASGGGADVEIGQPPRRGGARVHDPDTTPLGAPARSPTPRRAIPRRACTTCPISTKGWTRRVHFVQEGGGALIACAPPRPRAPADARGRARSAGRGGPTGRACLRWTCRACSSRASAVTAPCSAAAARRAAVGARRSRPRRASRWSPAARARARAGGTRPGRAIPRAALREAVRGEGRGVSD